MAKKRTSLDTLYFVNKSNKKISLEAFSGGIGQTSAIQIKIDGMIDEEFEGNLPETVLGQNKDLIDKDLILSCTITDTSKETNYTELIIRIRGGLLYAEYPLYATVDNEGDVVSYRCVIRFFNPA